MRRFAIVLFLCCLAGPARLVAQTAADCVRRGDALALKGEYDDAIAAYTQALIAANPNDPNDKRAASLAYNNRGSLWGRKGEPERAIADLNESLAIDPNNAVAYTDRGAAWHYMGEYDKAIADYDQAIAIDPKYAGAYHGRALVRKKKGEFDKAITDLNKALVIDPKDAARYTALAWIYATCPDPKYRDGKKAVEIASKAYQLSNGEHWYDPETLAAAYAESGDFAKAREFQEKAIELAPDNRKQECQSRLELYKQGKPYHAPPVKK